MTKARGRKILNRYTDDTDRDVLEGIAEALWVTAYASYIEEGGEGDRPGPQEDWYDFAPSVPDAAYDAADVLADAIIRMNRVDLRELVWDAKAAASRALEVKARSPGGGVIRRVARVDPAALGRALAMEAMGTGVRWDDDHPPFNHRVPSYFEVNYDGEFLHWSPERFSASDLGRDAGGTQRNPSALKAEEYEVVDGSNIVVGHVSATWLGDADTKAKREFGPNVTCFAVSAQKGRTPVGAKLWSGAKRNPGELVIVAENLTPDVRRALAYLVEPAIAAREDEPAPQAFYVLYCMGLADVCCESPVGWRATMAGARCHELGEGTVRR